ncbi:MAG: hypothetical protein ACXVI7_09175 [Halobacteriota archaeon]
MEFFGDVLNRIQSELETRDLSTISPEKLFAMYAHFYQEAQRALPEIEYKNEGEVEASKSGKQLLDDIHKSIQISGKG